LEFTLMLALLFERQKNVLLRNLIYLSFGLSIIALFMTGSRTTIFLAVSIVAVVAVAKAGYILSSSKAIIGLFMLVLIAAFTIFFTAPGKKAFGTWNARYEEGNENNEYLSRTSVLLYEINEVMFENPGGLMGFGIGSYQNGSSRFNKIGYLPGAEDQAHRIGLELGPMGLIIWYVTTLYLFIYSYRVYKFVRTPFLKNLALVLAIYAFWGPGLYRQTVVNWVDNACWWTCLGLVLAIKQVELNKRRNAMNARKVAIASADITNG
jgi:hypothetical protein